MTIRMFETDSVGKTIDTLTPRMNFRSLIAHGNAVAATGLNTTHGSQSIGYRDFDDGEVIAWGINEAAGIGTFEESGSGGFGTGAYGTAAGDRFYSTLLGVVSAFGNNDFWTKYECGKFTYDSQAGSSDREVILLLGGKTFLAKVGDFKFSGTGTFSITGLGFQPDAVLFVSPEFHELADPSTSFAIGDVYGYSIGAVGPDLTQWVCSTRTRGTINNSGNRESVFRSGYVLNYIAGTMRQTVDSLDADGFTITQSLAGNQIVGTYLALHDPDGDFSVGYGTEGDTSITTGFTPELVLFANAGTTADGTVQTGASIGFGSAVPEDLQQWSGFAAGRDNDLTKFATYYDSKAITMSLHPATTDPAVDAVAEVTAFNATTVDLNWTTGGTGGMKFGWMAVRLSDATGDRGCGANPQFYRRIYG